MTDREEFYKRFRQDRGGLGRPLVRPVRPAAPPQSQAPPAPRPDASVQSPSPPALPPAKVPLEAQLPDILAPLKTMAPAPMPRRKQERIRRWLRWRRLRTLGIGLALFLLLGAIGTGGYLWHSHQAAAGVAGIPQSVLDKIHYGVIAPKAGSIVADTAQYNQQQNSLRYELTGANGTTLTVNQQSLPQPFTDVPGYADRLYDGWHQYATIQTSLGTAHLTHPYGQSAPDVAVIATSTNLVLISSPSALTADQWTALLNGLHTLP